jgi:ABC-type polysaccharide/polyol phosphate export permease
MLAGSQDRIRGAAFDRRQHAPDQAPVAADRGVRQAVLILPHTHAIALLRDGFLGSHQSGLDAIWHLHSHLAMSLLSLAVLAIWAIGATLVAIRAFRRATLS